MNLRLLLCTVTFKHPFSHKTDKDHSSWQADIQLLYYFTHFGVFHIVYFTISLFFQELILQTIIMSSCNIFQLNGASDGFCNGGGVNSK